MSEVDQRVVQMKFDNAQFEAGVQQTLQSLNKLNKSIDENTKANNGKSLTGLTNAVSNLTGNFAKVESAANAVSKKFSVFGTIGDQVLRRIADGAMNTGKKLLNMINSPLEQIKNGGWSRASNINNARFQLNGLKIAWDSVNKDLQYAVNQTAYGLDSAANVASQLAASGIKIRDNIKLTSDNVDSLAENFKGMKSKALLANGSLDEMSIALRAISGVAAQTNSSYDDIGNVFARVAGQGRVMATDLNSLAARGMNAAATLGDALGKSEAEIRDMVSKGQIDFQTFSEAMYDAFADHAIDANNTFSGALANMKAALSKIGAEFFLPFLERVPKLFNAIRVSINDLKTDLMPFIKDINGFTAMIIDRLTEIVYSFKESGMIADVVNTLREAFYSLLLILHPIKDAFDAVFGSIGMNSFKGITGAIYSFVEAAHLSVTQMQGLYNISYKIFSVINIIGKVVTTVVGGALRLVKPLFNLLGSISDLIINIFKAFTGSKSNNDLSKKFMSISRSAKELYLSGIDKIAGFINKIADVIRKVNVSPFVEGLKSGAVAIKEWVKKLPVVNTLVGKISKTTKGSTSIFQSILKILDAAIKKVTSFINTVKNLPIVQRAISELASAFNVLKTIGLVVLSGIAIGISKIITAVSSLNLSSITSVLTKIFDTVDSLKAKIEGFFSSILSGNDAITAFKVNFFSLGDALSKIKEKVIDFFEVLTKKFKLDNAKDSLKGFTETLSQFAKRITPAKVAALALSGLFLAMAINITKVSGSLSKALEGATGVFGSIKEFFGSFKKKQSNKILDMAVAIGILAASIYTIAQIDKDKLKSSVAVIGILAGVITALTVVSVAASKAMNKLNGTKGGLNTLGVSLAAMASSILILVAAIKLLDKIDLTWDLVGKLAVVTAAVTALAGVAAVLTKFKAGSIKTALTVVTLAGSCYILAKSLEKMNGLDLATSIKSLAILAIAIGGMSVIAKVIGHIGIFSTVGLLLAVVTLDKILPKLDEISKYDFSKIKDSLEKNKDALIKLTAVVAVMSIVAKACGKGVASFGAGMVLIAVAIIMMVGVVKVLSRIDATSITNGIKALGKFVGLIAILEVLSFATKNAQMIKFASSLLIISGALLIMTGISALLGSMNPSTLDNGIKALSKLVGLIALLEICSAMTGKGGTSLKSVIALIMGISVLTGELIVMSLVPAKDMVMPLIAMDSMLLMLSKVLKSMTSISNKTSAAAIFKVVSVLLAIGEVTACLAVLADKPWSGLLAAAVSLGLVMMAISNMFTSMKATTGKVRARELIKIATALGSVALIAASLSAIANYDWKNLLAAGASITLVMFSVSSMFTVLSSMKATTKNIPGTLVSLGGSLAAMGAVALALSKLAVYDWKNMLAAGASISAVMLSLSAAALIISTIPVKGAALGTAGLVIVVAGITAIVAALGALYQLDEFKKLISDGGQALLKIGQAIGNFVGGIIGGVAEGVASTLPNIATYLSEFATNIQPFCTLMGSIDESVLTGTANFAKAILAITAADVLSGIGELFKPFTGSNEGFSSQLIALGEGITAYAQSVSSLSDDDIDKINLSAEATNALIRVADAIPNSGGLLGKIVGDNDLDDFGKMLVPFAEGLVSYGEKVQSITAAMVTGIQNSVDATKAIVEVADAIPNSGGLLGKIVGDNDLDDFGNTLVPLAEGLVNFGQKTLKITPQMVTSMDNAVQMVQKLSDLANSMENIGGIGSWFTGDNTLATFGKTLDTFALDLMSFANRWASIDKTAFDGVGDVVTKLVKAANDAASVNSDSFNGLNEALKTAGSNAVEQFILAFSGGETRVSNAIKQLMLKGADAALNGGTKKKFKDAGSELAKSLSEGFSSDLSFTNAVTWLINGAVNSISSNLKKFRSAGAKAGQAVIDGFGIDGIDPGEESHKAHGYVDLIESGTENSINENLPKLRKSGEKGGNGVIDPFGGAIKSGIEKAGSYLDNFASSVSSKYDSAIDQYKALYGDPSAYGSDDTSTKSTTSTNANTEAVKSNTKAKTSAAKATKAMTEEEKTLAKYTKYAAQTMDTYMKAFGMAFSAANSTDLISNTKEAFGELAEYIYQETQKNSDATTDATQTAEERAQAVMKAFNEAFESIRDSAKSSLDMFSSFDKKLSEKITPKEMLANFESQEKGITQFYNNLGILAAKGFNTGMVKSLMDEGPSAYAKVSGLLEATGEEIDKLNEKWNSKESVANKAAASAMTALMTSMQITKLKTLDAQRKKSVDTANESLNKYKEAIKSAQEANLDMEATLKIVQDQAADTGKTIEESGPTADLISSYNDLQKAMTDAGLSNEDLQTAMMDDSGFKFTENSMLTLINKMADLKATIAQFEDIGSQINDNVKSQLSSSVSYFDEWSAKYEMTGDQLMKNVQSQIEGIAKYNDSIKTIISNGGGQIVSMFGDKITPEIANAMAQLGNSALQTLQQQLQYIQAAPVQAGQQAQQAWFQYGQIGGMGYQTALSQLAQDQALMAQATTIGTNVAQGAVNGMTQSTSAVAAAGQQVGQAAINGVATGAQTHSPSVATTTMGQNIDQGLINGVNALSEAVVSACRAVGVRAVNGMQSGILMTKYALLGTVNTLIQQIITTFRNGLNADIFSVIGMQICNGLINGINAGRFGVINAAVDTATKAYAAVCEALDIGSPSRKMYWVGKMFDAGFTNGIRHGSEEMQHTVRENMETAVQTAVDLMNNTGEMQPTIRPVVDLSDAQNGSRLLSSMFSDIGPMRVNTGVGQITTPTDRMNAAIAGMNSGNSVTNGDTVLNIYATPGQNTKELADIVIKRLNNEYARRKAAWT